MEERLAAIYNAASDKQAVTDASNSIDSGLTHDPHTKTTFVDGYYYFRFDPLVVLLDIDSNVRRVQVVDVRYDPRNKE
jgi:hypothetical protein